MFLAFDLGSNSYNASLADQNGHILWETRRVVRLGTQLSPDGALYPEAFERPIEVARAMIDEARAKAAQYGAPNEILESRCVATRALRAASNANAFCGAFARCTGLSLDVITCDEEARLERLGQTNAPVILAHAGQPWLLIDVGGGSTELSWIDKTHQCTWTQSLNIGALSGSGERVGAHILQALASHTCAPTRLIVCAGSVFSSYAQHKLGLKDYRADAVEGARLDDEPHAMPLDLASLDDASHVGAHIVRSLQNAHPDTPIYATTRGLRHGLIADFLAKHTL